MGSVRMRIVKLSRPSPIDSGSWHLYIVCVPFGSHNLVGTMFGRKKTKDEPLTVTYSESDEGVVLIRLSGRLDSVSASDFQNEAVPRCRGKSAILDMEMVTYLSSAGLRAMLALDKAVGSGNKLSIINAKDSVKDVLDMSGFSEFI